MARKKSVHYVDNKKEELQQDEMLDDEFSGYKFTSKKLN